MSCAEDSPTIKSPKETRIDYQFYTLSPSMIIIATLLDASTSPPIPRHGQSRVIEDEIDDE